MWPMPDFIKFTERKTPDGAETFRLVNAAFVAEAVYNPQSKTLRLTLAHMDSAGQRRVVEISGAEADAGLIVLQNH